MSEASISYYHRLYPLYQKILIHFVDLFGGGFNVGINIETKHLVYNDICKQVVDLLEHFYNNDSEYIHNMILKPYLILD